MRLWTLQPYELYEKLKIQRILHCDPEQSELIAECGFGIAYNWLAEQMMLRVGPPPVGVKYPFWAWHTLEWKHQKPDMRRAEFHGYSGAHVCIELEIPDKNVLLSNEDMWHLVLNDCYYGDGINDQEYELENRWFESLTPNEQSRAKRISWEKIFDVYPPRGNEWYCHGKYIQATFWELRIDQVIHVRHFRGRSHSNR